MKSKYRYVGVLTESHSPSSGYKHDRLGSVLEMTPEEADNVHAGKAAWIPDAEFQALKFTPEELRRHAYSGQRIRTSPEFQAKMATALDIARTLIQAASDKLHAKADQPEALEAESVLIQWAPEPETHELALIEVEKETK